MRFNLTALVCLVGLAAPSPVSQLPEGTVKNNEEVVFETSKFDNSRASARLLRQPMQHAAVPEEETIKSRKLLPTSNRDHIDKLLLNEAFFMEMKCHGCDGKQAETKAGYGSFEVGKGDTKGLQDGEGEAATCVNCNGKPFNVIF